MDLLKSLLITFLILPLIALAQERTRDEHVYSLAATNYEFYPDPAVGCEWGAEFLYAEPVGGFTADVYATVTDPDTGMVSPGETMVGEAWFCFDSGGEVIGPGTRLGYSQGIVYYLNIHGVELGAQGTVVQTTPPGFPEELPSAGVFAASAAVVLVVEGEPGDAIGALTHTILQMPMSAGYPPFDFITLRLYPPRDYNQEALRDAINAAF